MRRVSTALTAFLLIGSVFADEVTLQHDDLTINGNLEVVEESDLTHGVILLLHGTLGHNGMEIISTLQSLFAENNRNSLAINLSLNVDDRHGFFPCEREHDYQIDDASSELIAWMSWLESKGASDIVLLGHSRGANQIARFIVDHRPNANAAILIAPSSRDELTTPDREANLKLAATGEWLRKVVFLHCSAATVSANSYLSHYGPSHRANTPALLNDVELPVLVFSGSEDTVVPNLAEDMAAVNRSNVKFEAIDGADHFFRDLYLYDIVDSTLRFLEARE